MKKIVLALCLCLVCVGSMEAKKTWKKGTAEWKKIQIQESLDYNHAFNTALEMVSNNYEMDLINKDGGYIRSEWSYMKNKKGKRIKDMRMRITIKFNHDRTQLQVRTEAQKLKRDEWIEGEDSALSKQIRDDLQGALGY